MLSKGWSSRIIWLRNILLFVIITRLGNVKCQCEVGWCESCQADPKICTKCIAPYYGLREDGSACERCRSGCLLCTRLSVCDVCVDPTSDGPVFDASGTCRPCAPDCSFCGLSGHGKCDLCQPGFRLTAGQTCKGSAVQTTTQTTTTTTKTTSITTTTTTTIPTPTTTHPITCSATQFQCRDGTCVNVEAICDGRRDCFDGSDEINNCGTWTTPSIVTQCPETTHMMCNNTHRCVRLSWRCDGYNDCGDDSDERNCVCNRTNQFECTSPQRCISLSRQCDGITDCVDRSDEINCTCEPLTQFQCSTTGPRCIPLYQTCDLQVDCLDGSDELNCSCTPAENRFRCENGKCVRKSVTCDFYNDCMDGSDERNCAYPVCNPATQFKCSSGQCIPLSARCDSFNNCIDKSDELFCNCSSSEHFQCVNGQCVSSSVRCNKVRDCDDGTDERECNAGCSSNQLMCESGWCLYTSSQCIKACPNLLCDGFIDCPDGSDEKNCSDDTILSTPPASTSVATTPTTTRAHSEYSQTPNHCKYNEFQCDNGHCVAAYYVCDKGDDCGDSSDENSCSEHSYKPLSNHFVLATDSQTPGLYQMSMISGEVRQLLGKKPRNPVAVAYDSTNRAIYWTDSVQRSINRFSLITRKNLAIFTITASSSTLEGLTIGDEGRLLFYTNVADGSVGQIGQISINGSVRHHSIISSQAGVIPKAIVFHSLTRALYWTDSGASPGIYRRMLDTKSATVIVSGRLLQPNALSIDFEEGKMYWADIGTHTLEVSGLDGSHRAVISQGSVEQYSSLALSATDIYIADWTAPSYIKIISRSTYAGRFYAQQKFGRINGLAAYSVKTDSAGCTIEWETHERRTIIGGGQSYGGNRSTAVECQGFCVALVQCVAISYSINEGCSVHTNPAAAIDQMTDAQDDSAVYVITRRCPTPLANGGCEGLGAFQCDNGWCLSVKHDCTSTWCNKVSLECDGFADCPDGSDEAYCTNITSGQCAPGEFSCSNGNCVSYSRLCSSQNSCGDNSQLEQCSGVCSELEMRCNNSGRCLAVSRRCDGSNDCGDFSDELNCACNETTQFHCVTAGRCIPLGWRCDGSNDCGDDSDEFNCSPVKRCNSSAEHECSSSGRCIPLSWKCDGFIDCGDNSDETNCSCSVNQFRCSNGQCVPLFYRCNGGMCVDGSDLLDCRACEVGEYRCDQTACRSLSSWCDGVVDCQDSSDEKDCSSTTRCPVGYGSCSFNTRDCIHQSLSCNGVADCTNATDEINCPCSTVTQFRCASGICVNGTAWCDGVVNCADGSDEPPECQIRCNPHQMLTCKNGRCVRVEDKCDGVNNCGDYSDEINCEACTSSFNSFTCAMGVCLPASAFCNKSRECPDGSDEPAHCEHLCSGSSFTCDNGRCIGKAYRCNGFNNCGDYSDEANCSCSAGQVKCDMGLCLSSSFWCDSYQDCPDGSDEKPGCTSVCPVNSRKCSLTGECISAFQICDRIRDCPDGSDEESCDCIAGEYRCETAGCISAAWLCDGTADCPLRDDEDPTRCNKCQPSQFVCTSDYQCTNSQHRCDGAVDCNDNTDEASCISLGQAGATVAEHSTRLLTAIYHGEHGYLICSHSWSDVLSNSVCLSMGYGNALVWSSNPKPADASRILAVHDSSDISTSSNFIQNLSRDSCGTGSVVGINCSQPECGVRKVHSDSIGSYIINGHIAEEGAWPWQAAVFYNGEMKCGGAVISKRWILTAAHCGYIFRSAHLIKVRVGSVFRTSDDGNAELFDVDLVTLHPAYSHGNVTHPGDVALLRLTTPIQYTDYIQPICLPTPDTTALQYSKLCVIAGFGATRYVNGRNSEFLLQGKVNVMSESTCRTAYAELGGTLSLTQEFLKYFICTGSQLNIHDISACTGDSGGPLVCVDQRNIWTVHGLISWGLRCDLTIYSRTSYYIDWIKDTISAN